MLYEGRTTTDRRCKVQDAPVACPFPNLLDGSESNHKGILFFTHLMYNCTLSATGNLLSFASRELQYRDSWRDTKPQSELEGKMMCFSYLLLSFPL